MHLLGPARLFIFNHFSHLHDYLALHGYKEKKIVQFKNKYGPEFNSSVKSGVTGTGPRG